MSTYSKVSAGAKALRIHDQALEAINRVETLTGLMLAVGDQPDSIPLDSRVVVSTGAMIEDEMARVREALEAMRRLVQA